jgi:hypothetical protein
LYQNNIATENKRKEGKASDFHDLDIVVKTGITENMYSHLEERILESNERSKGIHTIKSPVLE